MPSIFDSDTTNFDTTKIKGSPATIFLFIPSAAPDFPYPQHPRKPAPLALPAALPLNSNFLEIEHPVFTNFPRILLFGCLFAGQRRRGESKGPFWCEDHVTNIAWLNAQSPRSVVYAAFRSSSILDHRQFQELTDASSLFVLAPHHCHHFSAAALTLLGLAKAKISEQNYASSVVANLFNGYVAAASAYSIGWALRNVVGWK